MARQFATPPPSPRPPPPPSLLVQLNDITKRKHDRLNHYIVKRLPLALSPHKADPALLGLGLCKVARTFIRLEKVWHELIQGYEGYTDLDGTHDDDIRGILFLAHPEGIDRTGRLLGDMESLSRRTGWPFLDMLDDEDQDLDRLLAPLKTKPHLLIGYTWVLYMALFSGGRWIREQFNKAGLDFWLRPESRAFFEKCGQPLPECPGYSFLFFDDCSDGATVKGEYRATIVNFETALTSQERNEVLQAACDMFDFCIAWVDLLDKEAASLIPDPPKGRSWPVHTLLITVAVLVLGLLYWMGGFAKLHRRYTLLD